MKTNKNYQKEREKKWGTIKLKRETIFSLKSLEGELEMHTYDEVIKFLIGLAKH